MQAQNGIMTTTTVRPVAIRNNTPYSGQRLLILPIKTESMPNLNSRARSRPDFLYGLCIYRLAVCTGGRESRVSTTTTVRVQGNSTSYVLRTDNANQWSACMVNADDAD